ncbi:hypothetical protein ACFL6E_03855 [Candidatus Neomarinimicrobiota bacterium]
MKKHLAVSLLAGLFIIGNSTAEAKGTEVGVIVGDPTGLMVELDKGKSALAFALAYGNEHINVHGDYLLYNTKLISKDIPVFYGLGVGVHGGDEIGVSIRVPLGLKYHIGNSPLSLGLEVAPSFTVVPSTGTGVNGGIFLLYRF